MYLQCKLKGSASKSEQTLAFLDDPEVLIATDEEHRTRTPAQQRDRVCHYASKGSEVSIEVSARSFLRKLGEAERKGLVLRISRVPRGSDQRKAFMAYRESPGTFGAYCKRLQREAQRSRSTAEHEVAA
jgi:ribosomal protein L15E